MIFRSFIITLLATVSIASAQSQKTGEFILKATPAEVLGVDANNFQSNIRSDENISWEVYVPENYDPSNPSGVMVYAGAPNDVRAPAGWMSVMRDKNLIWVAARKSGNGASIHQKKLLAMMSIPMIEKHYQINKDRIYITGDGRTASRTALQYPNMFDGAILMGKNLWEDDAESKVKNALNNRYVFVSSESSAIAKGSRYAYNKFKKAGVENIDFLHIKGKHRYNRPKFAKSIDYLDE
jgi:predicted peptidase